MGRTSARALALLIGTALASNAGAEDAGKPAPLSESAKRMSVPEGFRVTLFAGEPDVRQPIAFEIDDRGRLWVAESLTYPEWTETPTGKDRIVILEDADGDGKLDKRKVFAEHLGNVSGIALGFGGVWVCSTPNFIFIPDRDADDKPDGPAVTLLDGWNLKQAGHNVFNALTWAPDGWLWGCNGIQSRSNVGPPGTPEDQRVKIDCGVWRYHPTKKTFEVVARGGTNFWGLDFDDRGEAFATNCVIDHVFRIIPGGHYRRMYGEDGNPYVYELLPGCADHLHWAGANWQDSREATNKRMDLGGGHAHVGAMIYLGDNWPERYRGSLLTCNLHGHRVNNDFFRREGSAPVAQHGKDFLLAGDDWFRGLQLKYGPDGGVYLTDWSDIGECHEFDEDGAHRENGRIYKITYQDAPKVSVDLAKLDDAALAEAQLHRNDWQVRRARRILQERAAAGKDLKAVRERLWEMFRSREEESRKLRAVWALNAIDGLGEPELIVLLDHPREAVRMWAVRLLGDRPDLSKTAIDRLASAAKNETSASVRVFLAALSQRVPLDRRASIVEKLVARGEDADDRDIPLMLWYAIEPIAGGDRDEGLRLLSSCRIPQVRRLLARRIVAADVKRGLAALLDRLKDAGSNARRDALDGAIEALRGRKTIPSPKDWKRIAEALAADKAEGVRSRAIRLGLLLGDPRSIETLRGSLRDDKANLEARRDALRALAERGVNGLAGDLQALLERPELRGEAIKALAAFDDPATPKAILRQYPLLNDAERADALTTLVARPATALALLEAMEKGTVARRDLSVANARHLLAFQDPKITAALEKSWGSLRPTSKEKSSLISKYKEILTSESLSKADASHGRAVFVRLCANCHKMFGEGGDVGPDLTGSDRANVDYVLENVLDPSASVGRDFLLHTIATIDGRLISGIIRERNPQRLIVQTVNERIVLPVEDVDSVKASNASMMPEGLFEGLPADDLRALIAYLRSPSQVPLAKPAAPRP